MSIEHMAEALDNALGVRLKGVQHFGLTVQDMERAYEFYTQVLGGTEVMRDGDFHGERIHNTLLADQDIEANVRGVNPRALGIPDLRGGTQRLDVRFIQFDNVVIELLKYRDAEPTSNGRATFAEPLDHMSPALPRMMHICFHVRDDVDFNRFIADLEAESARRGMTQVRANRVVTVRSEAERVAAPLSANSNSITEGRSNGWTLIYCKGPEGEQLEFVQAVGQVKQLFDEARRSRGVQYGELPPGAYAVVAEVRAKAGKADALRAITLPLIARVRQEANNLVYYAHEDAESPGHFVFYEIFVTKADFEAHNATPHVTRWLAELPALADGGVRIIRMGVLSSGPVERGEG
jgi:quinol monooxygenase YgiN/catechol 2,3-dioxygenase-like lactoylglutathione lyase family enzyme